jgi:hypothetical protein
MLTLRCATTRNTTSKDDSKGAERRYLLQTIPWQQIQGDGIQPLAWFRLGANLPNSAHENDKRVDSSIWGSKAQAETN